MSSTAGANSLTVKRDFTVDFVLVQAKFYPSVQNFYQQIRAGDEEQAVVAP